MKRRWLLYGIMPHLQGGADISLDTTEKAILLFHNGTN